MKKYFLVMFVFALFASCAFAQEPVYGDGILCPVEPNAVSPQAEPVPPPPDECYPGTEITYKFSRLKSELLKAKQEFPVSWTNNCLNDTRMISYTIDSQSELLKKGLKLYPVSERTVTFPSGRTSSSLIKYTVSADAGVAITAGIHRATLRVARGGTNPPLSVFYVELTVIDDDPVVSGDVTLDVLQRGYEYFMNPFKKEYSESLIFKIESDGYKNAKGAQGEVIKENDIAKLPANSMFKRGGITADGNTRLFLRAQLKLSSLPPGVDIERLEAFFTVTSNNAVRSDIKLESLNRDPSRSGSGAVKIKLSKIEGADNILQATAVLVAPASMQGTTADFRSDNILNVDVSILGIEGFEEKKSALLRMAQPPVVLIHGVWSSPEDSWGANSRSSTGGVYQQLLAREYVVELYRYPGTHGPLVHMTQNQVGLYSKITAALKLQTEKFNVACSQVDLVVHSMGGLMARRYMYDNKYYLGEGDTYYNASNYQNGAVRRLITIATPHYGSQLADFIIRKPLPRIAFDSADVNHRRAYERVTDRLGEYRLDPFDQFHGGKVIFIDPETEHAWTRTPVPAVQDLAPQGDSQFIKKINEKAFRPPVPMYCIAGNANGSFVASGVGSGWFKEYISTGFEIPKADVHGVVFGGPSDAIVAVSSAIPLVPENARFITQANTDYEHTELPGNYVIATQVLQALTAGLDKFTEPWPKKLPSEKSVFSDVSSSSSSAAASLKIPVTVNVKASDTILKSDRSTAVTGDSVKFTLTLPSAVNGTVSEVMLEIHEAFGVSTEYSMTKLTDATYELNYDITGGISGKLKARASVFTEENGDPADWLMSDFVELVVIPKMDELWDMAVVPYKEVVVFVKGEKRVDVLGAFDDGYDRYINEGVMGTTYTISDPSIASVNADGVVTGIKEGNTVLTIRNGSISTTAEITAMRTIEQIENPDPDPTPKGGGGCNATGYGVVALVGLAMLLRRKQ